MDKDPGSLKYPEGAPNGIPAVKLPPEVLERARQTLDEAEVLAGVREIERTGGRMLEDFIGELERRATART